MFIRFLASSRRISILKYHDFSGLPQPSLLWGSSLSIEKELNLEVLYFYEAVMNQTELRLLDLTVAWGTLDNTLQTAAFTDITWREERIGYNGRIQDEHSELLRRGCN